MDSYIPYEKLSKKQKRAADKARRNTWEMSPVTRVKENKKIYSRKRRSRDEGGMPDPAPFPVPEKTAGEAHHY